MRRRRFNFPVPIDGMGSAAIPIPQARKGALRIGCERRGSPSARAREVRSGSRYGPPMPDEITKIRKQFILQHIFGGSSYRRFCDGGSHAVPAHARCDRQAASSHAVSAPRCVMHTGCGQRNHRKWGGQPEIAHVQARAPRVFAKRSERQAQPRSTRGAGSILESFNVGLVILDRERSERERLHAEHVCRRGPPRRNARDQRFLL